MVVSKNKSTYPEITKAVGALKFAKANIIGVVMNRVSHEVKKGKSYESYSYKYKYKPIQTENNQQ